MSGIDVVLLKEVLQHLEAYGCTYEMGAKAPSLTADTFDVHSLDCSGFTRYALARASSQSFIIPDGSAEQHQWFMDNDYRQIPYNTVDGQGTDRLFIAFIAPDGSEPGHVWLVNNNNTLESHGSAGPSQRPWNTPILINNVCACYELPVQLAE